MKCAEMPAEVSFPICHKNSSLLSVLILRIADLSQKYFFQIIFLLTSQKSETLANREVMKVNPRENPCKNQGKPSCFYNFRPGSLKKK